jgi:hypothetical protein
MKGDERETDDWSEEESQMKGERRQTDEARREERWMMRGYRHR